MLDIETEARNPISIDLDRLTPRQFVELMSAEDANIVPAVLSQAEAIAQAIEIIARQLRDGGRLVYIGAGTSGRLGVLDASECPPTFNSPPGQVVGVIAGGEPALTRPIEGAEDHPEQGEADLIAVKLSKNDVLVGIATSGRTPYVLGGIAYARKLGTFTIGLSCTANSELAAAVDLAITPRVGPEVLSGSTRLKAGTATKLVLNMLTTGSMVQLGKTYGNLMVDLQTTNRKLQIRTRRIIREATGLHGDDAETLLNRCGHDLKTAMTSHLAGVSPEEAWQRLQSVGGYVRRAVEVHRNGHHLHNNPGAFLLGIDGGGTGTVALLAQLHKADDWTIIGRGEAGPSNRHSVGTERAFNELDRAVASAFQSAGMARQSVQSACLGLAGAGRNGDSDKIRQWAKETNIAASITVCPDATLLLAAGTPNGWGVAVVAGTGSMAYARSEDGRSHRSGGWGHVLGDEGSGYAIARASLTAIARAVDGRGPRTALTELGLADFDLKQPDELVHWVYHNSDCATVAQFAPRVLQAAEQGDAVAQTIVQAAARELALAVAAVVNALELGRVFPMALAGGLLVQSEYYRQRFVDAVAKHGFTPSPIGLVAEPAEGAVHLALQSTQHLV